ncbi:EamA family transporter [Hazenella sp. IB182357]|uniref:EamA family transporter n=1 Tax=Polycladospora coralii TaxID=2771432 RepID=A0A926N692_9BACL|nr:EamA family transporter [Polycladospora coralii]MBD1371771.1 EamA family transporter [Polycladospora coralii]
MMMRYLLMCLIFGTTFMSIKIGLNGGFPPFLFAGLRFFVGGILVLLFLGGWKYLRQVQGKMWLEMVGGGIGLTGLCFAALFWSEQYVSSGMAAMIVATKPLFTMLAGILLHKQSLRTTTIFALGFGFVSVLSILLSGVTILDTNGIIGLLALLFTELVYALTLIRFSSVTQSLSPITSNGLQLIFGGVFLLLLASLFELPFTHVLTQGAIWSLIYLTVFGTCIAYSLFFYLVKATNPVFPTTWTYISPLIALVLGWLFLAEKIMPLQIAGAVGVLISVLILHVERVHLSKTALTNESDLC